MQDESLSCSFDTANSIPVSTKLFLGIPPEFDYLLRGRVLLDTHSGTGVSLDLPFPPLLGSTDTRTGPCIVILN